MCADTFGRGSERDKEANSMSNEEQWAAGAEKDDDPLRNGGFGDEDWGDDEDEDDESWEEDDWDGTEDVV